MSKSGAIFSQTPGKQVKSSPASSRQNSARATTTTGIAGSSPRKCNIRTEVRSSPSTSRSGTINIRSKVQVSCPPSQSRLATAPSPRKDVKRNEDLKSQQNSKSYTVSGVVKFHNLRTDTTSAKPEQKEADSTSSDVPTPIDVKSMRSCFEQRETKVPSRPPPSPSPSRSRSRLAEASAATPKTTHTSLKGILVSKNRTPTFRVPSGNITPTPRTIKLRRSASVGTLTKLGSSPGKATLVRSSSQTLTPKHVKFQDEITPECFSPVLLESKGDHGSGDSISGEHTNLTVAVRVRPLSPGERGVVAVENNSVKVKALSTEHCFTYDYCFNSTGETSASQEFIFESLVKPLVDSAFQGYNVCLFAYGQTGSGKSYSMMGEEVGTGSVKIPESAGIIPRFTNEIFNIIESVEVYSDTKVEISYFEIYNEKIHDLLGPSQNGRSDPLRVREHPELGPYVVDLTMHNVHSYEKLEEWLDVGNSHKATAATEMNMNSSRSHSIFTVTLSQIQAEDRPSLCSKINLIDLAGSERLAYTCATGDRLKEGVSINRSLLTLGKVISSLAENKKRGFIPYRESVLTWLLKESLGGNSRTAMLATINPSYLFLDETLSTLRYAHQARNIVNTIRINESPHEKRIRELLEEIQKMKDEEYKVNHVDCDKKIRSLQEQIDEKTNYEIEIVTLRNEFMKTRELYNDSERKIHELQESLLDNDYKWKLKYDEKVNELEIRCFEAKEKYFNAVSQLEEIKQHVASKKTFSEVEVSRLEKENKESKELINQLHTDNCKLQKELSECKIQNTKYHEDLDNMKRSMSDIKINSSHDNCDNQILMLQTALKEAEKIGALYEERIKMLEKKCSETTNISNHNGCEKEISTLKCTIQELKEARDHSKCEETIERLKLVHVEAEHFISELESEIQKLNEDKHVLQLNIEETQNEIILLKNTISNKEKEMDHTECEERINTLKKALTVAKSMNVHVQCENRIIELEKEIRDMMNVTLMDHTQCEEKISSLFSAVEKYADENTKLKEKHKAEIAEHIEKNRQLKEEICRLTECEKRREKENNFETQVKSLKDENVRFKKKKVDDDKKISSLNQQVISLTKELLEVKSLLRASVREKESSDSLCVQLQEQLTQQDRKLKKTNHCSRQLFDVDDKENWETPSKVIRRSIAQYSKSGKENDRCSLVMKAEEIHQALKDAEEICARLKIPWVFHLEPEVTTHSWFDVNLRVWDQRTMSSVRWPREVFLGWLQEMKEEIMSKSRGQKLFQNSPWLQSSKDPEPLPTESGNSKERKPLEEEVEKLRRQIEALENRFKLKDKTEVLSALTVLGKAVTHLSNRLELCSPLKSIETNINIKVSESL